MKTRDQIRAEIQAANPSTEIAGERYFAGDAPYEELMEKWVDEMESRQADPSLTRKTWKSSADFWAAFTDSEKLAILASTIAGIILLREELRLWTGEVWSDDAKVQAGLGGLVATGIITAERKAAILAL